MRTGKQSTESYSHPNSSIMLPTFISLSKALALLLKQYILFLTHITGQQFIQDEKSDNLLGEAY